MPRPEEDDEASGSESSSAASQASNPLDYQVERILDYDKVWTTNTNLNEAEDPCYDPTLGTHKWQVRYLVKWLGYENPDDNSWEPKEMFLPWDVKYDRWLRKLESKRRETVQDLREQCERLNQDLREDLQRKKDVREAKRLRRRRSSTKESQSAGTSVPMSNSATSKGSRDSKEPKPAGRGTRNSGQVFDLSSYVAETGQSDPELLALVPDTPPKRDANGKLISSSDVEDEAEEEDRGVGSIAGKRRRSRSGSRGKEKGKEEEKDKGKRKEKKKVKEEKVQTSATSAPPPPPPPPVQHTMDDDEDDLGFVDDEDSDEERAPQTVPPPLPPSQTFRPPPPPQSRPSFPPPATSFEGVEDEFYADRMSVDPPSDTSPQPTSRPLPNSEEGSFVDSDEDGGSAGPSSKRRKLEKAKKPIAVVPTISQAAKKDLASFKIPKRKDQGGSNVAAASSPLVSRAPSPAIPIPELPPLLGSIQRHPSQTQIPPPFPPPLPTGPAQSRIPPPAPPVSRPLPTPPLKPSPKSLEPAPVPKPEPPAKAVDPRRRPSGNNGPPLASSSTANTSINRRPLDHFNQGLNRSNTTADGFITLNPEALSKSLTTVDWLKVGGTTGRPKENDVRILSRWGIPSVTENFYNFDKAVQDCTWWIFAPLKEVKLSKHAKLVLEDVTCLELLIGNRNGKETENLREGVKMIAIHVSEEKEISLGEFSKVGESKLSQLESWRSKIPEEVQFVTFGHGWKDNKPEKKGAFKTFWTAHASITISPAALIENPTTAFDIFTRATNSRKLFPGRRDKFCWIPATFIIEGGPFFVPKQKSAKEALAQDSPLLKATEILHRAIRHELLSLTQPIPFDPASSAEDLPAFSLAASISSHETLGFPNPVDACDYKEFELKVLDRWVKAAPSLSRTDVEWLQNRCGVWKGRYSQIRSWIIIVTEQEKQAAKPAAGVRLLTLAEALAFVS